MVLCLMLKSLSLQRSLFCVWCEVHSNFLNLQVAVPAFTAALAERVCAPHFIYLGLFCHKD